MATISLVRVGGVCAILAVVSITMARIVFGNAWLTSRGVETFIIGHWFYVLALLLAMAAALGFYQALHKAGAVLWIAVVAILTGFIFLLFYEFIRLGIGYELAPAIADASTATRPALEVMANTLRQTGRLAVDVGYVLIFGIGVLLFSFAILRTSVVPKWIGRLGLIVVVANVAEAAISSGVFPITKSYTVWTVAAVTSQLWLVAMGVVLLRLKEPVAPDSVA